MDRSFYRKGEGDVTCSDWNIATEPYKDLKRAGPIEEMPMECRFDEIVGGVKFYGKNID